MTSYECVMTHKMFAFWIQLPNSLSLSFYTYCLFDWLTGCLLACLLSYLPQWECLFFFFFFLFIHSFILNQVSHYHHYPLSMANKVCRTSDRARRKRGKYTHSHHIEGLFCSQKTFSYYSCCSSFMYFFLPYTNFFYFLFNSTSREFPHPLTHSLAIYILTVCIHY